jgi:hypothetical protein
VATGRGLAVAGGSVIRGRTVRSSTVTAGIAVNLLGKSSHPQR